MSIDHNSPLLKAFQVSLYLWNPCSLPFPQIEGRQSLMFVSQRTPVKPDWHVQLKALTMSVQVPKLLVQKARNTSSLPTSIFIFNTKNKNGNDYKNVYHKYREMIDTRQFPDCSYSLYSQVRIDRCSYSPNHCSFLVKTKPTNKKIYWEWKMHILIHMETSISITG